MSALRTVLVLSLLIGCGEKKPPTAAATPQPAQPVQTAPPPGAVTQAEPEPEPEPEPPPPPKAPVHERVNEAATLLMSDDATRVQQAMAALEEVVKDEPRVAEAHFNLGVARFKAGKTDGARRSWQTAVNLEPALGNGWLYLGRLQEESGRLPMAASNYKTGLRNDPENVDLAVALIGVLRKQGRLDEAISASRAALQINTNAFLIYNNMGLAYLDRGELALAKFVFQKALTVEGAKDNVYIQTNYGWVLWNMGEKGPATARLQKAVELDSSFVPAQVYLAHVYMEDHNYADAVELLERAAREDGDNHGVMMNLGIAYRGVGRLADSQKAYERALQLDPSNPDPHYNIGVLKGDYYSPKDYDGAVAAFEAYLNTGGKDVEQVQGFIEEVRKEQRRAEKKKKAAEARKKREAERAARKKLIEEDAKKRDDKKEEPPPPVWGNDPAPAPADDKKNEPPPEPAPSDSPWGSGGEEKKKEKTPPAGDSPW